MNIYNNSLFEITSKGKGGEKGEVAISGDYNLLFIGENFLTKGQLDPVERGEKEFLQNLHATHALS